MIGLTLTSQILIAGNVTGASLNPAVGIVLPFFSRVTFNHYQYKKYMWIWIVGPIVGGVLAAVQNIWNNSVQTKWAKFNEEQNPRP